MHGGQGRVGTEERRQRSQPPVGGLVLAHQLAGQGDGVDDLETRPRLAGRLRSGLEEGDVEAGVVRDEDTAAGELEEGGQHRVDARRLSDHAVGDPGEHLDERRDGGAWVDEGLELAEHLAATDLDRADLSDGAFVGAASGRLQVDHDKSHRVQRGAQVIEGALDCVHVFDRRTRV